MSCEEVRELPGVPLHLSSLGVDPSLLLPFKSLQVHCLLISSNNRPISCRKRLLRRHHHDAFLRRYILLQVLSIPPSSSQELLPGTQNSSFIVALGKSSPLP